MKTFIAAMALAIAFPAAAQAQPQGGRQPAQPDQHHGQAHGEDAGHHGQQQHGQQQGHACACCAHDENAGAERDRQGHAEGQGGEPRVSGDRPAR
jgi:hypothetical protein